MQGSNLARAGAHSRLELGCAPKASRIVSAAASSPSSAFSALRISRSRIAFSTSSAVSGNGYCGNAGATGPAADGNCSGSHTHDSAQQRVCIVWFKKDLRMDDHPGLVAAASSGYDAVIPLFVFDPLLLRGLSQALTKALVDAVSDLKVALQCSGSDLVIRTGRADDAILRIVEQVKVVDIITEDELEENLEKMVLQTWKTLRAKCQQRPALKKWTINLYKNQNLETLPDNYKKYTAAQNIVVAPLEAPALLAPVPSALCRGSVPSIKELEHLAAFYQSQRISPSIRNFSKRGALEILLHLLREGRAKKPAQRRHSVWLKRFLAWLPKVQAGGRFADSMEDSQLIRSGATDALQALKAYLQYPEATRGDWRILREGMQRLQRKKGASSFRHIFQTVLALGTISLRRILHEALHFNRNRWISSQIVAAVIEEVKHIEWYTFLLRKTQSQAAEDGWHIRAWKWRGFLVQYTTYGDQGPPVLLVHGFGAFWQHYRDNIKQLAGKGHRVWALTMLGFGRSEKPNIVYTELLWAELLRDFIIEVVGEPVVLVGNSLGGYIASLVSGLWGPLVRSLILLNAAGIVDPNYRSIENPKVIERTGVPRASSQVILFILQQQCTAVFKRCYPSKSERVDNWILDEALRASYDPGAASVLESMFYLRLPLPLNFLLDQYDGKTLVLQGIFDPLQNAFRKARTLQACCKNITVSIVNAGHCPHDEVPEEVNRIICGWIDDTCTPETEAPPEEDSNLNLEITSCRDSQVIQATDSL